MKNVFRSLMVAMAVLAIPMLVRAQSGCTDSPEDPTLVLALIASAGAVVHQVRARLGRRNSGR